MGICFNHVCSQNDWSMERVLMFKWKKFKAHSGDELLWKIECDTLSGKDIKCLAQLIAMKFSFSSVVGVPEGGLRLAKALEPFVSVGPKLIVDDVLTTGKSMDVYKNKYPGAIGVVIFARAIPANWIYPIFQLWRE